MIELDQVKMILGTGLSASKDYMEFKNIVQSCICNGINAFDTAPSYGTESLLGKVISELEQEKIVNRSECWVQTKIDPWQMQEKSGDISKYLNHSGKNLGVSYFDAVFIHWPIPEYLENTLHSLEIAKNNGLIRNIGVCNVRKRHIEELLAHNHKVDIVQIERHPLRTCDEDVEYFKSKNIAVQAYSPLCKMNSKIRNNTALQLLADKYKRNIGQIIMRWHISTGVIPVFTTKKVSRIQEYSNLLNFDLEPEDISLINLINENYKLYLESWLCPGY